MKDTDQISAEAERELKYEFQLSDDHSIRKHNRHVIKKALEAIIDKGLKDLHESRAAQAGEQGAVAELAGRLVERLDEIAKDERYRAVWFSYQNHGGKYDGPFYVDELDALRKALSQRPTPATVSEEK